MKHFINCFRIAKECGGVLYSSNLNGFSYSICKDLYGTPIIDFRTNNRYGKELSNEQKKSFYRTNI